MARAAEYLQKIWTAPYITTDEITYFNEYVNELRDTGTTSEYNLWNGRKNAFRLAINAAINFMNTFKTIDANNWDTKESTLNNYLNTISTNLGSSHMLYNMLNTFKNNVKTNVISTFKSAYNEMHTYNFNINITENTDILNEILEKPTSNIHKIIMGDSRSQYAMEHYVRTSFGKTQVGSEYSILTVYYDYRDEDFKLYNDPIELGDFVTQLLTYVVDNLVYLDTGLDIINADLLCLPFGNPTKYAPKAKGYLDKIGRGNVNQYVYGTHTVYIDGRPVKYSIHSEHTLHEHMAVNDYQSFIIRDNIDIINFCDLLLQDLVNTSYFNTSSTIYTKYKPIVDKYKNEYLPVAKLILDHKDNKKMSEKTAGTIQSNLETLSNRYNSIANTANETVRTLDSVMEEMQSTMPV